MVQTAQIVLFIILHYDKSFGRKIIILCKKDYLQKCPPPLFAKMPPHPELYENRYGHFFCRMHFLQVFTPLFF